MSKSIADIQLKNDFIAAPLAGYTDIAFRRLCLENGAAMAVTEMVSVKGLCYRNPQTERLLRISETEKPSCLQLFGSDYRDFVKADELGYLSKFDIIDINMGCPVNKVVKNGEGSALLKTPSVAADIVKSLCDRGRIVTVKMRSGFAENENVSVKFAMAMQDAGASMVTVHARTRAQLYGGKADYSITEAVKDALDIPVALSGDITDEESFLQRKNCADFYMIGRGALARPDIFNVLQGLKARSKRDLIMRHIELLCEYFEERYAVNQLRKFMAYYLKGERGTKELKAKVYCLDSVDKIKEEIEKVFI
mgnify:FL=1